MTTPLHPKNVPTPVADRCDAETNLMQHTHIRCDRARGHAGNHHAVVTGQQFQLARDGHSIRALAWQIEWRDDTAPHPVGPANAS